MEAYEYLEKQDEAMMKSFDKASITEAINFAKNVCARVANPFDQKRAAE